MPPPSRFCSTNVGPRHVNTLYHSGRRQHGFHWYLRQTLPANTDNRLSTTRTVHTFASHSESSRPQDEHIISSSGFPAHPSLPENGKQQMDDRQTPATVVHMIDSQVQVNIFPVTYPATKESTTTRNVSHQSSELASAGGTRHRRFGNMIGTALRKAATTMGFDLY